MKKTMVTMENAQAISELIGSLAQSQNKMQNSQWISEGKGGYSVAYNLDEAPCLLETVHRGLQRRVLVVERPRVIEMAFPRPRGLSDWKNCMHRTKPLDPVLVLSKVVGVGDSEARRIEVFLLGCDGLNKSLFVRHEAMSRWKAVVKAKPKSQSDPLPQRTACSDK